MKSIYAQHLYTIMYIVGRSREHICRVGTAKMMAVLIGLNFIAGAKLAEAQMQVAFL